LVKKHSCCFDWSNLAGCCDSIEYLIVQMTSYFNEQLIKDLNNCSDFVLDESHMHSTLLLVLKT